MQEDSSMIGQGVDTSKVNNPALKEWLAWTKKMWYQFYMLALQDIMTKLLEVL